MRLFKLAALSMVTFGCANYPITPISVKEQKTPATTEIAKAKCQKVQRDLRVSWEERNYWCNQYGISASNIKKKNQHIKKDASLKANQSKKNLISKVTDKTVDVVSVLQNLSKKDLEEVLAKLSVAYKNAVTQKAVSNTTVTQTPVFKPVKKTSETKVITQSTKPASKISDAELIWFAPNVEVLGPQGREKIESLITGDSDTDKILLRGYASEKLDAKRDDLDQLAVARALSVRKLLKQNGIDESKVKILYRNKAENGRFVEVIFNG